MPGGVGLADRPGRDLPARQGCGVLAAPGGAVPPYRASREHVPAHPRRRDLAVEFGGQLVQVAGVLSVVVGLVAHRLGLGAFFDPPALVVGRRVRFDDRLGLEVPAFPALGRPQRLARSAHAGHTLGESVPARDKHLLHRPGAEIGAAQLHRADASAVLDGQVLDDPAGQRHREPFGPRGLAGAGLGHQSPPSGRCRPDEAVAAQAAFGVQAVQAFEQEQAGAAQGARFVGAPGQLPHAAAPPAITSAAIASMSVSVTCPARARTGSGEASSRT